jgi:hypothetical protein
MVKQRFSAQLIAGHKGVATVLVPFNPETAWRKKPVRLAGRRHGWLVKGTANGAKFTGYIGDRWGRFFIALDEQLREAACVSVGDAVTMLVEPTATAKAWLAAREQSKNTTQPKKARSDAILFDEVPHHPGA